jgi:hypothetical protein
MLPSSSGTNTKPSKKPMSSRQQAEQLSLLPAFTLKVKATCSSKTSLDFQRITWRYVPEDRDLHSYHCENFKSCREILTETAESIREN